MRAQGRPRRSGCSGCLGLVCVLLALVAAVAVFGARMGVPMAEVARELARRAAVEYLGADDGLDGRDVEVGYSGASLQEGQQEAYRQMLEGLMRLDDGILLLGVSADDIDPAYKAIMRDHPELFWLDGSCSFTYTPFGGVVTVEPGTIVPLGQVDALRAQIEAVADAFLQTLPTDADDYAVARAAYEYVIRTTDYSLDSQNNQSMMSVFLGHSSVCAGYARAFEYLLHRRGIPCAYVEGTITDTGEEHAWNMACLNGAWTYVDVTWGDPTYLGDTDGLMQSGIIYDYLCLTTDEVQRDRHAFADPAAWPQCTAAELDYYRRAGLLFDAYDPATLSQAFWQQEQAGEQVAAFKFSNDEAYAQAVGALNEGTFLYDDLISLANARGGDSLRYGYTVSDGLRIVKLFW